MQFPEEGSERRTSFFLFVVKEQFPTLIQLLAEEPNQKRQNNNQHVFFPQNRTTYKGKTHASYFTLQPSEWLQQIITCMDDKKLCFLFPDFFAHSDQWLPPVSFPGIDVLYFS